MSDRSLIVDTGFFLGDFRFDSKKIYTVEGVVNELKSLKANLRAEAFSPIIYKPSKSTLKEIKNIAEKLGEKGLSLTDIELLAAAYDLSKKEEVVLLSDDYSIQNLAKHLNINFEAISGKKIKRKITWVYYCKVCGKEIRFGAKKCIVCGNENFSRKPAKGT